MDEFDSLAHHGSILDDDSQPPLTPHGLLDTIECGSG